MAQLSISILGPPKITIDGVPIKIRTIRAIPLLAYLSITAKPQFRETIANLLWSDSNLTQGLAALRTTLWRMKSAGLDSWISIDKDKISLTENMPIKVDVLDFKDRVDKCKAHGHPISQVCLLCIPNLTEAVDVYRGEFLSGINFSKAQVFEEWRLQEGEILHALYLDVLEKLTKGHRMFGEFNLSIYYAQILLREDRYNETAHSDLMQLYSITGQRAAAINQYKQYKNFLLRDLGLLPAPEITLLYKQILSGKDTPNTGLKAKTPVFLVADIENAAAFWEQAGGRKSEILSTYHNIFKETASHFGGYILQKSDGKLTLLFEKGQPLHCAVTIHLKIKKAEWGSTGAPIVRMVLYSAAADHDTNYDFSMLTRDTTNLLSMTWGGQIVFTEKTLQVIEQPPGSKIRDLGFYSLGDSRPAVHIFELLHPHVPITDHHNLRSGIPHAVNFPVLSPGFIGREAELAGLSTLVEPIEGRVITLLGPGGVGKTRLAIEFAEQNTDRFSDGAYFIPLSSIDDPELIPIALADALNFSFYGTRNHTNQLISYLHRMKVLLVFDNFEHLRGRGSEFLAYLVNGTHYAKILVTSRERLNLLSEFIMEIQGLPVPASDNVEDIESYGSIKLFLGNAHRVYPRMDHKSELPSILRICRLVNGLPLGIILASSWVRMFTCQQIADEIEKNLEFLTVSTPDLPPRHRSLRVVFDNSWNLLSNDERLMLTRLSIFPKHFSLASAQVICGASLPMLSAFMDKSLLLKTSDRFEMLDTFRQYTRSKLESAVEQTAALREKFMEYFAKFCSQKNLELSSILQRQALKELNVEIDNICTAWEWMIEFNRWDLVENSKQGLLNYHAITGNFTRGRELFEHALNKLAYIADPSLKLLQTSIRMQMAWMMIRTGFTSKGLEILIECLEIFRQENAGWNLIMVQMLIADSNRMLGNLSQAKDSIQDALQGFQNGSFSTTDEMVAIQANCFALLGSIELELGNLETARSYLQNSLATMERLGAAWGSIKPMMGLGRLAYTEGDFIQSRNLFLQALETAERLYDQRGMAMIHNNLAAVYELISNIPESYSHLLTSLKLCKETGDRRLIAMLLNNLAFHHLRYLANYADSIHTYHESIQIFSELGDLRGVAFSYYDISKAYIKVGLIGEAREYCLRSLQTAMTLDSIPLVLHSLHGFANLDASTGEIERALRLCCLIDSQPQTEPDTRKRVMVSKLELELLLPERVIEDARAWGKTTILQDVIDQFLMSSTP